MHPDRRGPDARTARDTGPRTSTSRAASRTASTSSTCGTTCSRSSRRARGTRPRPARSCPRDRPEHSREVRRGAQAAVRLSAPRAATLHPAAHTTTPVVLIGAGILPACPGDVRAPSTIHVRPSGPQEWREPGGILPPRAGAAGWRVDAASCSSHNDSGRAHRRRHPAGLPWGRPGAFNYPCAALRAAGVVRTRRLPAASCRAQRATRARGVLPLALDLGGGCRAGV